MPALYNKIPILWELSHTSIQSAMQMRYPAPHMLIFYPFSHFDMNIIPRHSADPPPISSHQS